MLEQLARYTYVSKYARYNEEEGRRETWEEAVARVEGMHLRRYPQAKKEICWAFDRMREKRVLGSQRVLQFGGSGVERCHARAYNCFSQDTTFVTTAGTKSFRDFSDGDTVKVLTHKGNWKTAVVRNYGKQELFDIVLSRNTGKHTVRATKNHRWLKRDGSETTDLQVGDKLMPAPNVFTEFNYNSAPPDERLYWCYGFVFGDGTLVKNENGEYSYSMVRMCGCDVKYKGRFEEMGFSTSTSMSLEGDFMAFTGTYKKTAPDPSHDEPRLIRAFVRGYLDADGEKNSNSIRDETAVHRKKWYSPNLFKSIQSSNHAGIDFIKKVFPVAGVYVVSETDLTGQETNFSTRGETSRFQIITAFSKFAAAFTVESITSVGHGDSWCLEVEDDKSFVLPFGLSTGNCTSSYCDRLRFFQEAFWLLLAGSGVGFSVQKHHTSRLPRFSKQDRVRLQHQVYSVEDSIEGWADALGVLLSSYFADPVFPQYQDSYVTFDYSKVRPAGSPLSTSSGKAPGPDPLRKSLEVVRELLDRCVRGGRSRLRPIDAYDIVMHASDAVLSGGVRRSATICLFSPDDDEMATAKTGNWFYENPQRGRSNNSAMLLRSETTKEQFDKLMKSVREYGEPGFIFSDSTELCVNPSLRAGTLVMTSSGILPIEQLDGKEFLVKNLRGSWEKAVCRLSGKNQRLYLVKLKGGQGCYSTAEHKWPVYDKQTRLFRKKTTAELSSGDKLATLFQTSLFDGEEGRYKDGFTWGWSFRKKQDKRLPELTWTSSEEYRKGLIEALFSAEGCISKRNGKIRLLFVAKHEKVADDVSALLGFYGIQSKVRHSCNKHTVVIKDRQSCAHFANVFKFATRREDELLDELRGDQYYAPTNGTVEVFLVQKTNLYEDVWDISVNDSTHCFQLSNCVTGNCVEIGMYPVDVETGESGWEACNLSEVNVSKIKNKSDFEMAAKAAAIIGTIQAGYTDLPYLGEVSERIFRREALLGVSMTGMMENPDIVFDPDIQREMAELVKSVNADVAKIIGINPAARCTCVKPSGTASCLLGTSSGIHPHHAKLYLRRVQANNMEEPFKFYRKHNPLAVEDSLWSANKTDSVITFCVEVDDKAMTKNDVDALTLLRYVRSTQKNWVLPGTRPELCTKPWLTHNVSNTINVREDEWEKVAEYIYENREYFCGISLIPMTGDKDYAQAPFCAVIRPEEIVKKYGEGSIMASGLIVDALRVFNNLWFACDAALGFGEEIHPDGSKLTADKIDWVRRARQFAKRYFKDDVRMMTYCLKDVHSWKLFCDLKRECVEVDYTEMKESTDNTKPLETIACAGGRCEI